MPAKRRTRAIPKSASSSKTAITPKTQTAPGTVVPPRTVAPAALKLSMQAPTAKSTVQSVPTPPAVMTRPVIATPVAGGVSKITISPPSSSSAPTLGSNATITKGPGNVLLGSVAVQPTTVQPGQPVLVMACDPSGDPYSGDSGVEITIEGIPAPYRFLQFATVGNRDLTVRAVKGTVDESIVVTVQVAGDPLSFRLTLTVPPLTGLPVIQVAPSLANPYLAQFNLGTPRSLLPTLALQHPFTAPTVSAAANAASIVTPAAALAAPASGAVSSTPGASVTPMVSGAAEDLQSQITGLFASVPTSQVSKVPTKTVTLADGSVFTGSGSSVLTDGSVNVTPIPTAYQWDFGDGTTATTQSPNVTHDYFPAIQADDVARSFDVTCTVVHDNLTVKRTLVLFSVYGLCKQTGTIVPYVTGDVYATLQTSGFSGTLLVNNLESVPIVLTKMAIVPMSENASAAPPAPQFTSLQTPITIAANQSSAVGVYVLLSELSQLSALGPSLPGFRVLYQGTASDANSTPVSFCHTFLISLTASGMAVATFVPLPPIQVFNAPSALSAASSIASGTTPVSATAVSPVGAQVVDPKTHTLAMALPIRASTPAAKATVRAAVQAGLQAGARTVPPAIAAAASKSRPPAAKPSPRLSGPPQPGPVAAGQICDPDNISAADAASAAAQGLVCQTTSSTQMVEMPASFQNALMGDVILSPGGDGADQIIANMLRSLTPPQLYSHSGIMTQNFYQITHCTAAQQRFAANTVGPGGLNGIQPDVLQYGWPGTITESIDDATNGAPWTDPGGTTYTIGGFTDDELGIICNGNFVLVPPLVVKPLYQNEMTARPGLIAAAATALSKGATADSNGNVTYNGGCYYDFYGYSNPAVASGFTDSAPAAAGWAQGMSPAVCSAFIWLCMKANNIPLVSQNQYELPSDLSASAIAGGAEVGAATLDGLFYYSLAQRQEAADVLYQIFQNMVLQAEGFWAYLPGISTAVADDISDQILNQFAFDNPNEYGSNAWQNPGDANAVSPSDIQFWNPPYFGYSEYLQYLPDHTEEYTISRWTKIVVQGTISGVVTINGAPVAGAYVSAYDGMSDVTDSNGRYTLNDIPSGTYNITASVVSNNMEYTGSQPANLPATSNPSIVVNVPLSTNPDQFRTLQLNYQESCNHSDWNPGNTHGVETDGPNQNSFDVNPGQITNTMQYTFTYDGGGYFSIEYDVTGTLAEDLSIEVTIVANMMNQGSSAVVGSQTITFNVPMNGQYAGYIDLTVSGTTYTNGPSTFTFTASNLQDTG